MIAKMQKLEVVFFRTEQGSEPVREWLQSLPKPDRQIIGQNMMTVQYGWPVGMPLVRSLGQRLWEVRSVLLRGVARIIFLFDNDCMVLLHGFIKKTQSTPLHELALAKKRSVIYMTS